jgi:hypothetical protein
MLNTHILIVSTSIKKTNLYIEYLKRDNSIEPSQMIEHDCCKSAGLKFIRENVNQYVKSTYDKMKYIILKNAHYLTMDAQSSLRRTIETSSHTTRFILTTLKTRLLIKPIISRLSHILLDDHQIEESQFYYTDDICYKDTNYNRSLNNMKYMKNWKDNKDILEGINQLYESGFTIHNLLEYNSDNINQSYYPNISDERMKLLLYTIEKIA